MIFNIFGEFLKTKKFFNKKFVLKFTVSTKKSYFVLGIAVHVLEFNLIGTYTKFQHYF